MQQALAEMPFYLLLTWLLAHLLFRAAVPIVSAALGVLLARAVGGNVRFLFLAIGTYTVFETAFAFVQLGLGGQSADIGSMDLISLLVTIGYYVLAFVLAYRWLYSQMTPQASMPNT
jgi:hypothetical protein